MRLIGSTIVGELFDTAAFTLIAFTGSGFMSGKDMFKFIIMGWIFKTVIEIIMLPITYRVIAYLKKQDKSDSDDKNTNFSPFKLKV